MTLEFAVRYTLWQFSWSGTVELCEKENAFHRLTVWTYTSDSKVWGLPSIDKTAVSVFRGGVKIRSLELFESSAATHHNIFTIINRFFYVLTYLLTPWCRVLLEKLTGLQLVKNFPAFYGTRRFITAFISFRHPSLSWASLTLILRRSRTGTVWFYTSTSNKRAARPKLYTKTLTGDLKLMYSRFTLVRISINL